ncbi:MAG: type I secretion system permease/ATPase, partial [Pseudomonadota bacterium]
AVNTGQIAHDLALDPNNISEIDLHKSAKAVSFKIKERDIALEKLQDAHFPIIAIDKENNPVIIIKKTDTQFLIQDFQTPRPQLVEQEEFAARYSGKLFFVMADGILADALRRFDIKWFIPVIKKYKRLFFEVLAASFFIQLVALLTPLFFQVVMDKVLVHQAFSTLKLVVIGMGAIAIFEIILTLLRSYVFTHTVARVDVELGAKLFKHILSLPIGFFHIRRTGETVARVRELENVRSFLTGNAVTLVMDALFSVIFIAVMFYYSGFLTWIVIASLPAYLILSLLITPILRSNLNEKFARGAENQAFLVESVTGVETIKSMAMEPVWNKQWDEKLSDYVRTVFRTGITENTASAAVTFVSKVTTILLLWGGAYLVIQGDLTVGQLIAFNMLSGQVSGPIIRIAGLWTSFQQVLISVERLGDILNTPTETQGQKISPPQLKGDISFDNVTFRYVPDAPEVIKNVSADFKSGQIIGLVGRSGSGKSTITKLLQRLYTPERGRISIDGLDLAHCDVAAIRRQMSVVLQENILFNRSVRDNIALAMPAAPIEKIIEAAQIAGAHDFISEMSQGYDTPVGEMGASLSGGQRQRIALARAILPNPRILILDEATSALDYETEHIIIKNMPKISQNRTVIIIAHRLSCVRMADQIYVMDKGEIVQSGTFKELLDHKDGPFAQLHQAQYA